MKIETLKDVKEFLNSLTDEQLEQEFICVLDERPAIRIISGKITNEDLCVDKDDNFIEPRSLFDKQEGLEIAFPKGTVLFYQEC